MVMGRKGCVKLSAITTACSGWCVSAASFLPMPEQVNSAARVSRGATS